MKAIDKKDGTRIDLSDWCCCDSNGTEYRWKDLILIPEEGETVNPKYLHDNKNRKKLREKFAGQVMPTIISKISYSTIIGPETMLKKKIAKAAVEFADLLIDELNKETK